MMRVVVFTLFFLSSFCSHAQYQVKHFTTENGLPSNGIKGLQWDEKTGFLWIATEAGMVRYNGEDFITYDVNTNPDLGSSRIVCLLKNEAGNIFVAGEKGNLLAIEENTLITKVKAENMARYNFNYYCAITASDTLFKQCFKTPWPEDKFAIFYNTAISINDTSCVAWALGNLYYYSVSTKRPTLITAAGGDIKSAFKIDDDLYYVNANNEILSAVVYKNKYFRQRITDEYGNPLTLMDNNSKLFWQVGMESPVLLQKGKAWVLKKESSKQLKAQLIATGIPGNSFFNFAQYNSVHHYLFLASASKGLYVIQQNKLTTQKPGISNISEVNAFYSQMELPNGNIMTGEGKVIGDNPSLNKYGLNNFSHYTFPLSESELIFDIKDSFYIYNRNTLSKQFIFYFRTHGNHAFTFSGKKLYFASDDAIGVLNDKYQPYILKSFDSKASAHLDLADLIEISRDMLAFATCDGLFSFNTKTLSIDTLLQIPSVCIRTLYKEGDYLFIGTYGGGYYVMKNKVLKPMPLDANGYLKYTHCFIKDSDGFYWISTNNGLFKVKAADMIEAYEKNLPQIYYHYFGKDDGMETTEMNGGCTPCAIRLRSGNFSFPTMDGLVWLNPEKTTMSLPGGKIYIDKFLADGKQIDIRNQELVFLPVHTNKIEIDLALNAWCKKENLYLDYKLNNENWQKAEMTTGFPKISFNNLGYGNYIITVRKMNGFGVGNYSYATISFTIATPFYQQWWFRILGLLILIAIGYLIFKIRLQQYAAKQKKLEYLVQQKTQDLNLKNLQLEKNDRIKTRLISVINHDIITPLKFMHYSGKALMDNKNHIKPDQQAETIADITQTAKDMEQLSSQILNWIIYQNPNTQMQKEEFDLHQLSETVLRVLQFQAKEKNTKLINQVSSHFVVYQFLEPMRVMIYNLVMNSLNFTKDGTIYIKGSKHAGIIALEISDTGIGMTQEQLANIFSDERIIASVNVDNKKGTGLGYVIIKDLLQMMEGKLDIKSEKNAGTTVSVSMPG